MAVGDVAVKEWFDANMPAASWIGPVVGALLVVAVGKMLAARAQASEPALEDLADTKHSSEAGHK
jgi:H+/gluconate symporter-like permease